jgi:hypothetical protein
VKSPAGPPGSPKPGASGSAPPPSAHRPLFDRLLALGVENTARALPLVEDVRKRLGWKETELDAVWVGAASSPDPLAFLLSLSKLADSLST